MEQRKDGVKKEVSKCETADISETPNTDRMFGRLMKFTLSALYDNLPLFRYVHFHIATVCSTFIFSTHDS